jgi:tetratricopeptide (TPR) repeat protein
MTSMELQIYKKTISEIVEIIKKEINNPDTFVALTSVVHDDSPSETLKKLLDELKLYGISDVLNPQIFTETLPKKNASLPDPDYQIWGWDESMYRDFIALPFFILIFDKPKGFTHIEKDNIQFENWAIFLFDEHVVSQHTEMEWLKSIIQSSIPFEKRSLRPVTMEELRQKENEHNAVFELRFLEILFKLPLRPSSVRTMYVASKQHSIENKIPQKSLRQHTPETPRYSELIDNDKISNDKSYSSEKSIGWFEFAVHLDPKNFHAWHTLGFIYKDAGNYEKSENCFRQCIRHNVGFVNAYQSLSHLLTSQGFFKKALQVIEDGLKHHSTADLYNSKALCHLELGEYDECIIESKKSLDIIKKEPTHFDTNIVNSVFLFTVTVAVRALMATNRISEIVSIYEPVLKRFPDSYSSHNNFGYFLQKDEQGERAVEYWKKAMSIEPDNWEALVNLGIHFHDTNNFVESSLYFDRSLKTCPNELQNNITNRNMDSLKKFRDKEMKKSFGEKVSELGGFSITGNQQADVKNFVRLLNGCKNGIFWIDPYFSKGGFSWIRESCTPPTGITHVKILSSSKKIVELKGLPFKKEFNKTKEQLEKNKISFSLKVVSKIEHIMKIHGRCVVSENGSWEIPSVNNIQNGSKDKISPSDREVSEFDAEWNDALDFENDYDEIKKLKDIIKTNEKTR